MRKKKRGFLLVDKVETELVKDGYTVNQQSQSLIEETEKKGKQPNDDEFDSLLSVDCEMLNEDPIAILGLKIQQANTKSEEKQEASVSVDQVKIFEHFMKIHNINHVATQY